MDEGLPTWTREDIERYMELGTAKTAVILIDGYIVDLKEYTSEHVGLFRWTNLLIHVNTSSSPYLPMRSLADSLF